jgi:O-methyltransferase involved in polyketide biosynthesis
MAAHPGGVVVELAAGLETQFQRCDDGRVQWLCADLPEGIAVRQRFLPPSQRCRYIESSALDFAWFDQVDPARGVFVTAQGLLMYFTQEDVRRLVVALAERFPGVEMMFDTIPRWFSRKTVKGYSRTRHYKTPPMPWGIGRSEIAPLLRSWTPRIASVTTQPYGFARGPGRALMWLCRLPTPFRNLSPAIVHLTTHAEHR